jgi:hypothetical protein
LAPSSNSISLKNSDFSLKNELKTKDEQLQYYMAERLKIQTELDYVDENIDHIVNPALNKLYQ